MRKRHYFIYTCTVLLLLLLFIFPVECIAAGKKGLLLWFNVVVPTLFPFLILSQIIIHSPIINGINRLFSPIFKNTLGLSGNGCYALVMGLLSGYPMGAVITSNLVTENHITKEEARYLLTFCNNPSIMFTVGFVAAALFGNVHLGVPFLICIYCGSLMTALLYKRLYRYSYKQSRLPKVSQQQKKNLGFSFSNFDGWILKTAEVLVKVGGYIVFFSIPIALFSKLPLKHSIFTFFMSTLELSNGTSILAAGSMDSVLKYAFVCSLCAFGSFSVIGQTASVIRGSGLSIKQYLLAKCFHATFTFCIAYVAFGHFFKL